MKFTLFFDMGNAAFEDSPAEEVARILRAIADKVAGENDVPGFFQTIRDANGNDIGRYAAKTADYR